MRWQRCGQGSAASLVVLRDGVAGVGVGGWFARTGAAGAAKTIGEGNAKTIGERRSETPDVCPSDWCEAPAAVAGGVDELLGQGAWRV